jgi:hypothetical protein
VYVAPDFHARPWTLATVGPGYEPERSPPAEPFGGSAVGMSPFVARTPVPVASVESVLELIDRCVPSAMSSSAEPLTFPKAAR